MTTEKPTIGSRWRNWKTGDVYTVVRLSLFCDTDHEARLLVIYEKENGESFARSLHEWDDVMPGGVRRFTEVG
jgi:hypothetical protein